MIIFISSSRLSALLIEWHFILVGYDENFSPDHD